MKKGIKQTWLAEKLGKSFNMVNAYVCNRKQPSLEILNQIAEILQVNIKDFMLTNPPYGKTWTPDKKALSVGPKGAIIDKRFMLKGSYKDVFKRKLIDHIETNFEVFKEYNDNKEFRDFFAGTMFKIMQRDFVKYNLNK